jgi:hypothetical protein
MKLKLTVYNRQAKVSVVPSVAALVIKALKEPKHDRKKTKNIKHNRNISLNDIVEIAKVMSPHSMGSQGDGLNHPHPARWGWPCHLHGQRGRGQIFLFYFIFIFWKYIFF